MITITINMASLMSDIKVKSYMNTQRLKAEDAYAVRAAEENDAEVRQAVQDAWRDLVALCREFLDTTNDTSGNDTLPGTITGNRTLSFNVSTRRTSNIADSLAESAHSYLVANALRRFYTSAAAADLAGGHKALEDLSAQSINNLLYKKAEPIYA